MNEVQTPATQTPEFDEAEIAAYLVAHPEFARRHPEAFEAQDIAHVTQGAASLIERQVAVLRQTNRELAARFESLVATARANEHRVVELNRVARVMVGATDVDAMLERLIDCLKTDLAVDRVYIGLTGALPAEVARIETLVEDSDAGRALVNTFRRGKPICGEITPTQAAALFPADEASPMASAAAIPLGRQRVVGAIVLASADPGRFTADMGTLFVELFGELLSATLTRLLGAEPMA
ncbi:DUF484 family protein [Salinisphaera sp. Q1T1-3]|uniref:DUF484 family protein n=1 Tax=Salinisphaera sp. Q1T1-3 TaxID=2321229 RepID=UPI000E740E2F|nr:DUF484 family protein [Salinisphaera sp. Q1T1-3]RJS93371.1 DUF484 family protein [Salinisphaera sp. Q1T1-3]